MLSQDFYRASASQGLLRAGRVCGGREGAFTPSFTSRTVAAFAAGRMGGAPSFAAASVREAGFAAFAAKEGAKNDWVQDFLKDLAAVRCAGAAARGARLVPGGAGRTGQRAREGGDHVYWATRAAGRATCAFAGGPAAPPRSGPNRLWAHPTPLCEGHRTPPARVRGRCRTGGVVDGRHARGDRVTPP